MSPGRSVLRAAQPAAAALGLASASPSASAALATSVAASTPVAFSSAAGAGAGAGPATAGLGWIVPWARGMLPAVGPAGPRPVPPGPRAQDAAPEDHTGPGSAGHEPGCDPDGKAAAGRGARPRPAQPPPGVPQRPGAASAEAASPNCPLAPHRAPGPIRGAMRLQRLAGVPCRSPASGLGAAGRCFATLSPTSTTLAPGSAALDADSPRPPPSAAAAPRWPLDTSSRPASTSASTSASTPAPASPSPLHRSPSPSPAPRPSSAPASSAASPRAASPSAVQSASPGFAVQRSMSQYAEAAVYAGPAPRNPARVTLRTIRKKYEQGEPITMVTAYDYPSAVHVDAAGIDMLLVGDSVAMVVHGHDTTLPITLDEMLVHCKAAARGARRSFLVGDLPFGCYETDVRDAVRSAVRMLKEGGMDAVKLEGGSPARVEAARAIVETGVAVIGHVGLTPQSVSVIGGFRPQAQVADEALRVLDQAQALQKAGCFALVLECIPGPIAAAITAALSIPTIGIGAGTQCSGQVLVYHDLLGMMTHPHHAKVTPKFCKQYGRVGNVISAALSQYRQEVEERSFPGPRFSPYKISPGEVKALAEELRRRGMGSAAQAVLEEAHAAAAAKERMAEEDAAGGSASPPASS
ncbi:hypothetical protein HYH03_001624 [Edaphochlamys debaryana]|uniref:3-methyl-2-oxobutanoate hydroxymethyltransferase n=1 Tax=Edaphochlamys debaryana TaxID=47281 RepID=A0A836C684_9CHLO|nr:hypothetical protein HYH03_001624 [Edaphochlamys debaryana]|eukprot:KAG2500863.1 hypothetical protein HYH03_001624 [Edaphochlamys debaryana]